MRIVRVIIEARGFTPDTNVGETPNYGGWNALTKIPENWPSLNK